VYDACAESRAMTAAFGQGKLGDEYAVLRPCEECLQLLIRCSPEAMVILSHDGKIMKTKIQYLGANSRMNALVEQSGEN
jgi:cytidine deaminase